MAAALGNGTGPGAGPGAAAPPAGERALGSGRGARPGERHWLRAAASSPRPCPASPHITPCLPCGRPPFPPAPRALPVPPLPPRCCGPVRALGARQPRMDAPQSPLGCPRCATPAPLVPEFPALPRPCGTRGCRPVFTPGAPGPFLGRPAAASPRRCPAGSACPAPPARAAAAALSRLLLPSTSGACPAGIGVLMVKDAGVQKRAVNVPSLLSVEAMIYVPSYHKLVAYSSVFSCI
ncbi:uncharacterized protein LOC131581278 [Poecile atricapillus]|uniref:uncharacterized protein LOC131581278 n=1 Tax=Poecile atricapillus TaxID=48891 RepID=UPI002739408A|nr:uncharacterized protein LOC131581278 [Poecile atricapillus]